MPSNSVLLHQSMTSLVGRHWGKREFAVLIVVVAIVLLLLDIVIHAVLKHRKAKASA